MDRFDQMRTFVKVVERGSFAATARDLGIAASLATTHVQALEARLGARLLNRSTRHLAVTEIGAAFVSKCSEILNSLVEAENTVEVMQATASGTLRVNLSLAMPNLIFPVIKQYMAAFPRISVEVDLSSQMIDIVERGIDISIRHSPVPDSSLISKKLCDYRFIICGSPRYFRDRPKPVSPADLADHNCLVYTDSGFGTRWPVTGHDGGIEISGDFSTNSVTLLMEAVMAGKGLVLAPDFVMMEHLATGALQSVLGEFLQTIHTISIVYPHRRLLPKKVTSFIEMLTNHFRAIPLAA